MNSKSLDDVGPHPLVRAVLGLLVGVAAGAVVALLLPRERHDDTLAGARQGPASRARS